MTVPLRMSDDEEQPPMMSAMMAPLGPLQPPDLSAFAGPKPQVTNPRMQREDQLQNKMSAYDNPEPPHGFMGHLAHGLNIFRNIAETALTPNIAAADPTSMLYKSRKHDEEEKELDHLQGLDQGEKKAAQENVNQGIENEQRQAVTKHENAQTEDLENKPAPATPDLAHAYANAVQQAIAVGADPNTDPVVQHIADAIRNIQPEKQDKGLSYQTVVGPDKKPHTYGLDAKGNKVSDLGEHYEKPQVVNVNAGDASIDRLAGRLGKPYQTALTAGQSQLDKIDEASAMIGGSPEAQALGIPKVLTALVSGQGSGVRITQPELNAIAKARGLQGDVEGTLNSWAGKGKLTPTQQSQLKAILADAKGRIQTKIGIHSEALDKMNSAGSREDIQGADHDARQHLNELETHGFYTGQKIPGKGTVVGFKDGKVQVDDAR